MAWSLKDISKFLMTVKFSADDTLRGGEKVLDDYSSFIYTGFLDYMVDQGAPEYFYELKEGESVELGYHTEYIE